MSNKTNKKNNDLVTNLTKNKNALLIGGGALVFVFLLIVFLVLGGQEKSNPVLSEKSDPQTNLISSDKVKALLDNAKKNNKNAEATKYYVGHLYFPTKPSISEPMVKHNQNNDFFLHRDAFENPREKGAVFLDFEAKSDFSNPLTIIYGHSDFYGNKPNDNVLFTSFRHYKDKKHMEENREFFIVTKDQKILRGQVFAYHFLNSNDRNADDFYVMNFKGNRTQSQFVEMLKQKAVHFDPSVKVNKDDKLVVFSTCYDYNQPERHVVYAKLEEVKGEDTKK